MHEWSDAERQAIGDLERDLGSAELTAVLSEWVSTQVHRAFATTTVLGCWRTQLIAQGWDERTTEAALPLILDRIWPTTNSARQYMPMAEFMDQVTDQITDYILSEDEDDEDDED